MAVPISFRIDPAYNAVLQAFWPTMGYRNFTLKKWELVSPTSDHQLPVNLEPGMVPNDVVNVMVPDDLCDKGQCIILQCVALGRDGKPLETLAVENMYPAGRGYEQG